MIKNILLAFLFLVTGCSLDSLSNSDFRIENYDDDHIYIRQKSTSQVVIEEHVVDSLVHDDSLYVLRMVAESPDCYDDRGVPTIITHYSDIKEYWIINLKTNGIEGPFNEEEFQARTDGLNISLSVPKRYYPNTKAFLARMANCQKMKSK